MIFKEVNTTQRNPIIKAPIRVTVAFGNRLSLGEKLIDKLVYVGLNKRAETFKKEIDRN